MKGGGFSVLPICLLMFLFVTFAEINQVDARVEAFNFRSVGTESATVVVPDDYSTIQEAINNAADGDTIFVKAGTYYEHVTVSKSLTLLGEDKDVTIIDGSMTGNVVRVTHDYVNIRGFTIQRSGRAFSNSGIYVGGVRHCDISANYIVDNEFGVHGSPTNTSITDNTIEGNFLGVDFQSGATDNVISGNRLLANYVGVHLNLADANYILQNNMTSNWRSVTLWDSENNKVYHNNFLNNTFGSTTYANFLDNGFEGNYWSNYTGVDLDHDGIGDSPYVIDANNTDHYPLMGMFSSFNTSYGYAVDFVSNSSILNASFNPSPVGVYPLEAVLSFNISGETGTGGFLRVCIPKILINSSYVVRFDYEVITNTTYPRVRELPCSNETYTYFYINYSHSEHTITVSGTSACAFGIVVVPHDYATIQEAINNAIDGDTIYVESGVYWEHVVVNRTVSLVGEDVSTTIIDGNHKGHVVHILSDYVNVTGFTIQNSGKVHMPSLDAGVCLNGTTGCTVSENRVLNNGFSAVSLIYSYGNTIVYNNLNGTGWGGIHLMSSSRNIVSGNIISDKYGGVNGHVSSNYNNITENNITNCTYGMFFHASIRNRIYGNNISNISVEGMWLQDGVSDNVVIGNRLVNATVAIRLQGPNYNNVVSGNLLTNGRCGVKIENARYTDVYNNTIAHYYGDEWDAGIRLDSSGYTRIHSNLIVDNGRGIVLYTSSPFVSVYENNVTGNDYGIRVAMGGSSYVNISDNYVANNRGYGIGVTGFGGLGGSNYATIARNLVVNNMFEAVGLGIGSSYNMVVGNTMIGNGHAGVTLERYSNYNTIIQNNIIENAYGICFDLYTVNSTHNTIFNNNLVNNTQQVRIVQGSVNAWNGSYPTGGNYWSDYVGVDVNSFPNQDVPGSDGMGDTPYVIDAINRDNYPLMKPFAAPVGICDVAVLNVTPCMNVTWMGSSVGINVTVENKGDCPDNRSVTVYCDSDLIGTRTVALAPGENVTLVFTWDTADVAPGNHIIRAVASVVLAEANTADNVLVDGTVGIKMLGDLNGDNKVDTKDIALAALAFGSYSYPVTSPRWNPYADLNGDSRIDIRDLALIAKHFGETYP